MATLKDEVERIMALQHRLAVWEAIYSYLDDNFVRKEGRSAGKAIRATGCRVEVVPETMIEDIMNTLAEGPIKELKGDINRSETQEVLPFIDTPSLVS